MPFKVIDVFHELVVSAFVLLKKETNNQKQFQMISMHLNYHASGNFRKSGFPAKQTF